ncbi:unnamed protein product [Leptosia nina]|uniref:Uncharacterized protein n=1 Tax=Leptosia nina TaxID=320188 RepID=A0AAV1JTD9_9NEOP
MRRNSSCTYLNFPFPVSLLHGGPPTTGAKTKFPSEVELEWASAAIGRSRVTSSRKSCGLKMGVCVRLSHEWAPGPRPRRAP